MFMDFLSVVGGVFIVLALAGGVGLLLMARLHQASAETTEVKTVAATAAAVMLSEAALMEGLAVSEQHPVWRALLCVLDRKIQGAVVQVSDPELLKTDAGALPVVHTAGGLEWLRDLREELVELRLEAERRQVMEDVDARAG